MAAYYGTRKSNGPVTRSSSFNRPSSSSFASASTSTFTAARSIQRSASPTRVNLYSKYSNPSLSFSITRPGSPLSFYFRFSPARFTLSEEDLHVLAHQPPRFFPLQLAQGRTQQQPGFTNDVVWELQPVEYEALRHEELSGSNRYGGGDLVKRALSALIRPSSHHQRRRGEFRPRLQPALRHVKSLGCFGR